MFKKVLALTMALAMVFALTACGGSSDSSSDADVTDGDNSGYTIATVVKLTGVAWFDRMEVGVNQFAADTGVDAYQTGHNTADPSEQVRVIEDLIAQEVDAICVVPNSTEALESVLKKAMDAGIIVIAHEASDIQNAHYDVEAFDNSAYGQHFMEVLGPMMGEAGQYTTYVGSLTATSHNEWVNASVAYQEANFPNMEQVSPKNETTEDSDIAYQKTVELLKTYPDVIGFQGSAMTDVPGVARAVTEMGIEDSTFVVGTSLVSVSGQYLETGAIDMISFWDPALAGYAMNEIALMMLKGEEPTDGMSLQAEGYQNLQLIDGVFYGQAWIDATVENMGDYDF